MNNVLRIFCIISLITIIEPCFSQSNYSLSFNGTNGVTHISANPIFNITSDTISIVCWIKPQFPTGIDTFSIIFGGQGAYRTLDNIYYAFGLIYGGGVHIKYSDGTNTVMYSNLTNLVNDNSWHNLIIMIPPNHSYPMLFVDNSLKSMIKTQANGTNDPSLITTDKGYSMGSNWDSLAFANHFNGNLYGFSVWNRGLHNSELDIYSKCLPIGNENGLVAFWNFHEGIGSTTTDVTSNSIVNNIISGTTWSTDVPTLTCPLGIVDNDNKEFNLYIQPNIGKGIYQISSDCIINNLRISNIFGQVIYNSLINNNSLGISINTSGIYLISATIEGQKITKKLIVE